MYLKTRNVNTGFQTLVSMFATGEYQSEDGAWGRLAGGKIPLVKRPSRNGPVLMIDEPVTVTYTHPRERVLFNAARDANPFFHLYEALWMLAGRNDVAPVAYYASKMADYSDNGKTLNGAYGYRWRNVWIPRAITADEIKSAGANPAEYALMAMDEAAGPVDQLDLIVSHLKHEPASRRAVLQMWNAEDDLLKIDGGGPDAVFSKDVCCNLSVMFSLREAEYDPEEACNPNTAPPGRPFLDMTVTSRSEDLVWGLLGADYVDFTILQEYVAARLGAEVGVYHHFTNNLHAYEWNWKPDEWLAAEEAAGKPTMEYYQSMNFMNVGAETFKFIPLVRDPAVFERELPEFVEVNHGAIVGDQVWTEPFLKDVARPMCRAFFEHKSRSPGTALEWAEKITADDWRIAATAWLRRKQK